VDSRPAFSASEAALEGFNLMRRHWRSVLGWAAFNLLALAMLVLVTALLGVIAAAIGADIRGPLAMTAGALLALGACVIQAIIVGGVFRMEIRPGETAFLGLRLGRDELRLLAVWIITLTGAWTALWAATAVGQMAHVPPAWLAAAAMVLLIYLGLRFSLAAPVAFAERRIDFPRSWRLTRGRALALLGMQAMVLSLIAVVMVTVLFALALVAAGSAGLDGLAGLFGGQESLQRHPGLYVLEFAVEIVLTPVMWVLATAPLIAAYRALGGVETAAP